MPRIVAYDNFLRADKESSKGKRFRPEVMEFNNDLCANLLSLEADFLSGEYESGRYRERFVFIPQTRLIQVSQFRDRVAQQAIYGELCQILDKHYIHHSYACRKGKGSVQASLNLQSWLRQISRKPDAKSWVCGKIDVAKFFYRIDHEVVMETYAKYIDDPLLLNIIGSIINCRHTAFGLPEGRTCTDTPKGERLFDVGVPIGSLMSQTTANLIMNEVDQFAKHILHIHYYTRYMDDIIILAPSKAQLNEWMDAIRVFMETRLRLKCNRKTQIIPLSHGIPFVGKRIWASHILLRKSTAKHMKRALRHLAEEYAAYEIDLDYALQVVVSYYGLLKYCSGDGLKKWIADNIVFVRGGPPTDMPEDYDNAPDELNIEADSAASEELALFYDMR